MIHSYTTLFFAKKNKQQVRVPNSKTGRMRGIIDYKFQIAQSLIIDFFILTVISVQHNLSSLFQHCPNETSVGSQTKRDDN